MGGTSGSRQIVLKFWRLMASNDFASTSAVLADDFVLEWPQSRERIRGVKNFARMNSEYPACGPWTFEIHRLVSDQNQAVTDVAITDGVQVARAISFFTLVNGKISRLVEYWPEPFEAPPNRSHLVERME
ncbi:MAG TPA: nuclear transport factor 2 family protein [Burkholderiaceae bacterium]|nr:nuclear transport factor 2 family protein [Burkholderiaceae bacterium]